jgi:uncharacterized damage-inducible protein DinB
MIRDSFIAELMHESAMTQKILERVPMEKKEWKPHEKSMSLGRLATHVADTVQWVSRVTTADEFDFATGHLKSGVAADREELMTLYQSGLDNAIKDLSTIADEEFSKHWKVKWGNTVVFDAPKSVALRGWAYSHLIHHRGQLSVYLRLLDVPVPGMYGPSADEKA